MGTHADMRPLSQVVSDDNLQQHKMHQHGNEDVDHGCVDELSSCRFSRADAGPGERVLAAEVEPQVGTGVKVESGTGVPVGDGVGDAAQTRVRAVTWIEDVIGVEAGAADGAAVGTGSRNGSEARAADRDSFGATDGVHLQIRGEDAVKAGDRSRTGTDRAGVPPGARPWSAHPRSKERRYRSSHRLVLHYLVPCMNSYGMCIIDNFLGSKTGERILHEVQELHHAGRMRDGELASRGPDNTRSIRGDQIVWVEGKESGCENIGYLLSRMDRLITYADGKLGKHKIRGRHSKVSVLVEGQGSVLKPGPTSRYQVSETPAGFYSSQISLSKC